MNHPNVQSGRSGFTPRFVAATHTTHRAVAFALCWLGLITLVRAAPPVALKHVTANGADFAYADVGAGVPCARRLSRLVIAVRRACVPLSRHRRQSALPLSEPADRSRSRASPVSPREKIPWR